MPSKTTPPPEKRQEQEQDFQLREALKRLAVAWNAKLIFLSPSR